MLPQHKIDEIYEESDKNQLQEAILVLTDKKLDIYVKMIQSNNKNGLNEVYKTLEKAQNRLLTKYLEKYGQK